MTGSSYDLVIIGGGIGGATLGKVMALDGARVLILEKERTFKDRVRGDAMASWGVPEARLLGVETLLLATCGQEVPWVDSYLGKMQIEHRHLPTTTCCETSELAFYHPSMQEVILQAAVDAGAAVVRGTKSRAENGPASASSSMAIPSMWKRGLWSVPMAGCLLPGDWESSTCRPTRSSESSRAC